MRKAIKTDEKYSGMMDQERERRKEAETGEHIAYRQMDREWWQCWGHPGRGRTVARDEFFHLLSLLTAECPHTHSGDRISWKAVGP